MPATAALVLAALLALCGVAGCAGAKQSGRMKVAATIVPLADFCRNVGGDLVEVQTLIPPGASSHVFEPTASQFVFVNRSKVFVMNGLNLEGWASGVIQKVGRRGMVVVVTAEAVPESMLIKAGAFNGEQEPGAPFDPHVWLDPTIAIYQVEAIRDGFIKADPSHRDRYTANTAAYVGKLQALDREIAAKTAAFKNRQFVALHPGWAYFSRRYGIMQAAAVQEFPEQEPSGKQIARVVEEIKDKKIKVIFAEPQISAKAADVIASSVPGVKVYFIDPLGDPGKPGVRTYIETMRHNLAVMEGVLR
ncbi:MAG: metal ABC transporter substrate-binding protein [Candidatus Geothermincolia bacterium]